MTASRKAASAWRTRRGRRKAQSPAFWVRQASWGGVFRTDFPRNGSDLALYHPDLLRHLEGCPALVLNADYTPLSYYPLSLWPWQTAVKAVFLERVDIVAAYEREVRSPRSRCGYRA